ncbi:MAG: hypothetical protein RLZZ196_712 [Bacteroidota bacterium]|jgi:hypothetical protein
MSIIKAYYVTRASSAAGYTDDGDTFNEIANFSSYFDTQVAAVGIDPNNGNKVIFAGQSSGTQTIKVSDDNGTNFLADPLGDWTTFNIDIDAANGSRFIVLDSNIFIINGTQGIYKSIDGGQTFNIVTSDFSSLVGFTIQRSKLWMIDEYNGILGLSSTVTTDANKLFLTSDGGITWTPITGYDSVSDNTQLISAVYMNSTASIMYVVGTLRIIRSTDGGNTWSTGVSFTGGVSPTYGAGFSVVNDTVQYVLGTSGGQNNALFKPNGIFWDLISTDNTVNQSFLLSFYNELEGYTSRYINGENQILRTFDGGATWNSVDTAPSSVVTLESVLYNCGECPDKFLKTSESQCEGTVSGPNLCPPGSVYDEATQSCLGSENCTPTDIVFVLDVGGSVSVDELQQMKDFLLSFINQTNISTGLSNGSIKLGFAKFGGSSPAYPPIALSTSLALTNNVANITQFINTAVATVAGGTNTSSGLERGIDILFDPAFRTPNAIRKLVLVTDGWPASVANQSPGFSETYVISNQGLTSPTLSQSFTVSSQQTPPCNRVPGSNNITDCDRCNIYNTTMEIADYIKNTLDVHITLAILTGETPTNLNTVLTPAENPIQAPTVEGFLTYRALVEGYIDHMTYIFPPSQNPSSPYYVASGYQPPSPVVGGNLGLTGLTDQVTGIPYGRFLFNTDLSSYRIGTVPSGESTTGLPYFTSNGSLSWPALPLIYSDLVFGITLFDPFRIWNCNEPGDPANAYAPICSLNDDGSNDAYVKLFTEAAEILAPAIAQSICLTSSPVTCPEGCTAVVSGTNVRCECPKVLSITPCVYNIYDCSNLQTPLYCTNSDLSLYIGSDIVVNIQVDGDPVSGCYVVGTSTIDYCHPLDLSEIIVTNQFTACSECAPSFVKLSSCSNPEVFIYVESVYLTQNVGKSVELFEYPGLCWLVESQSSFPSNISNVSVKKIFDDCDCCKQYMCNI